MHPLSPSDLRIFEATARLGGMNRAASELNTVQSNVTTRIRHLEAQLDSKLFERHGRGISLTSAGHRLLPYARRIAALLGEAQRAVRDEGAPAGPLTIGSLESTAAIRLAGRLTAYTTAFPDVDLTLRAGTTCEMVDQVLDHTLEGAFVCGPVDHPDLCEETVFEEELVLMSAAVFPSAEAALDAKGLRAIVLREGCSYRQKLEAFLARRGIAGARKLEFGTLEAIVSCVGAGLGITMLPRALVTEAHRTGRIALHTLPPEEARVETVFVRRRDAFLSTALTAFLETVRSG
ncbi:MAG: LysR family transcriptional regulator [Rhodospirillaceae bacterium]|nr:LysR family transcriptional regulator [Rhodospirillaceae bacterium]